MNHFTKLLNFEIDRFSKIFLSLIALTFVSQVGGMLYTSYSFLDGYKKNKELSSAVPYDVNPYVNIQFIDGTRSFFFWAPIAVCVTVIAIYIFFIWYRDWFATNAFIYRLLMLPIKRSYLFITKALTILLYTLGLVAFQILNLHFLKFIFEAIIPSEARGETDIINVINSDVYLRILVPSKLDEFFIYYYFGLAVVLILFTAILIERCFRLKGIFIALTYLIAIVASLIGILVYLDFARLFPSDYLLIIIAYTGAVSIGSIFLSNYLLNKKITV